MSLLIKGMKMPKEDELLCIKIYPSGKVTFDMDLQCKQIAEAFELPDHGDLIDMDEQIERARRLDLSTGDIIIAMLCTAPVVITAERSEE